MTTHQNNSTDNNREIIELSTNGRKIFVVSDLHMAAGLKDNGNYDGTENFYADSSFVRFLDHLQTNLEKEKRKGILIINGDFIDFLRISEFPKNTSRKNDFVYWKEILKLVNIQKTETDLCQSISDKERKYGLKTHDYKSVWKLDVCIKGHKAVFKRLAKWVQQDNLLLVVKGNHDLEWTWSAVRDYLRIALVKLLNDDEAQDENSIRQMKDNVLFVDDALILDKRVYIEHGHRYEKITWPKGEAILPNGEELNLPFGSFINRYLINKFELSYPFLDNVRPTPNILKTLLKENFPKALRVITAELPYALSMVPRRYFAFILQYLLPLVLLILLPITAALTTFLTINKNGGFQGAFLSGKVIGSLVLCVAAYFVAYYLGKAILSLLIKKEPAFPQNAKTIFEEVGAKYEKLEAVLMGHTHDPEQNNLVEKDPEQRDCMKAGDATNSNIRPKPKYQWYFNTGTWIPVFETDSSDVRFDKTYTFISIDSNETPACRELLQRWNDDAVRVDTMILNDKI